MLKYAMVRDIVKYSLRLLIALNILLTWQVYITGDMFVVFGLALLTIVLFDTHTKLCK